MVSWRPAGGGRGSAPLPQELTGIGGYYPKDPALLSWRAQGQLALQVFPGSAAREEDRRVHTGGSDGVLARARRPEAAAVDGPRADRSLRRGGRPGAGRRRGRAQRPRREAGVRRGSVNRASAARRDVRTRRRRTIRRGDHPAQRRAGRQNRRPTWRRALRSRSRAQSLPVRRASAALGRSPRRLGRGDRRRVAFLRRGRSPGRPLGARRGAVASTGRAGCGAGVQSADPSPVSRLPCRRERDARPGRPDVREPQRQPGRRGAARGRRHPPGGGASNRAPSHPDRHRSAHAHGAAAGRSEAAKRRDRPPRRHPGGATRAGVRSTTRPGRPSSNGPAASSGARRRPRTRPRPTR